MITVVDSGFLTEHESLEHLKIVAEWDFIQNDAVTSNQDKDPPDQHDHGTFVLSTIAGYNVGRLVGPGINVSTSTPSIDYIPAYNAEYLLAKCELVEQEIRVEEDLFNEVILKVDLIYNGYYF
jgi:subtilisin family serine protease